MNQKVCNIYDWIILVLSDIYFCYASVFLYYYTVDRKGKSYPLILLNAAIIMGIQISQVCILVQRILFDIQTRGINMCSQNVHSMGNLLFSDMEKGNDLFHSYCINLISGFQSVTSSNLLFQRFIACFLRFFHDFSHTLSLCFSHIKEITVCLCYSFQFFFLCLCIGQPCVSTLHLLFRLSL